MIKKSLLIVLLIGLISLLLAGQAIAKPEDNTGDSEMATVVNFAPENVSLQLNWVHTTEYAGVYMAQEKGYYADENLEVEILEGGFDDEGNFINSLDILASGEVQFGVVDGAALLQAREACEPYVAIAAIFQRSPAAFMSLVDRDIVSPLDLRNASVAINFESATGVAFKAMLASQGIALEDINLVPREGFGNEQLTDGEVDVLDAFITNQPVQLEAQGYELNIILASDYGFDMYNNVFFTTEDLINNNPDLVERFVRATVRGLQSAVDNPEEATAMTLEYGTDLDEDLELKSMLRAVPLINPTHSQPGMMEASVWELAHQTLLDQGILSEPLDIDAAYTLEFLNKAYGNQ